MADTHAKHHDYHLLNPSPWPIIGSAAALVLAIGAIVWMKSLNGGAGVFGLKGSWLFGIGVMGVLFTMFMWWRDVIREAHAGDHTPVVQIHLRYGMMSKDLIWQFPGAADLQSSFLQQIRKQKWLDSSLVAADRARCS